MYIISTQLLLKTVITRWNVNVHFNFYNWKIITKLQRYYWKNYIGCTKAFQAIEKWTFWSSIEYYIGKIIINSMLLSYLAIK